MPVVHYMEEVGVDVEVVKHQVERYRHLVRVVHQEYMTQEQVVPQVPVVYHLHQVERVIMVQVVSVVVVVEEVEEH
jgi:hypothetical protein